MPLNIDLQQVLLHMLNFVILFAVLYFLLYKPVKKFIDDRAEYYKKLDDEANKKLAEAENSKQQYTEMLKNADSEIKQNIAEQAAKLEQLECAKLEQAKQDAAKIVEDAKKEAQLERQKILDDAKSELYTIATEIAKKIVTEDDGKVYDEFLNSIEGQNVNE